MVAPAAARADATSADAWACLTGRGLTTRPMTVDGVSAFNVDLDLLDHRLDLSRDDGVRWSMDLPGRSVAEFHRGLVAEPAALGLLGQVNLLLEEFAGRFSGKASPVHHFWHAMDIAHTRFSDRVVA